MKKLINQINFFGTHAIISNIKLSLTNNSSDIINIRLGTIAITLLNQVIPDIA